MSPALRGNVRWGCGLLVQVQSGAAKVQRYEEPQDPVKQESSARRLHQVAPLEQANGLLAPGSIKIGNFILFTWWVSEVEGCVVSHTCRQEARVRRGERASGKVRGRANGQQRSRLQPRARCISAQQSHQICVICKHYCGANLFIQALLGVEAWEKPSRSEGLADQRLIWPTLQGPVTQPLVTDSSPTLQPPSTIAAG